MDGASDRADPKLAKSGPPDMSVNKKPQGQVLWLCLTYQSEPFTALVSKQGQNDNIYDGFLCTT